LNIYPESETAYLGGGDLDRERERGRDRDRDRDAPRESLRLYE
jgi:hypothetical protein